MLGIIVQQIEPRSNIEIFREKSRAEELTEEVKPAEDLRSLTEENSGNENNSSDAIDIYFFQMCLGFSTGNVSSCLTGG